MIFKAPAKINLGLHVKGKRDDGFHELESVFCQIPLFDFIELIPSEKDSFHSYHIEIPGNSENNLCIKAMNLLRSNGFTIPPYEIHLLKNIPIGAGLGGGSSDAVAVLQGINRLENLGISDLRLQEFSAEIGSDCPFFCGNSSARVTGRGEFIAPVDFDIQGKFIHLVHPNVHISTGEAYASLDLEKTSKETIVLPRQNSEWENCFTNDFEAPLYREYPALQHIKDELIKSGAFYASLSGSGSSIFGIFDTLPTKKLFLEEEYSEWILEL